MWYVSYNSSPCDGHTYYRPFCNGSGWGNEAATVACREEGFSFGLGSKFVALLPMCIGSCVHFMVIFSLVVRVCSS